MLIFMAIGTKFKNKIRLQIYVTEEVAKKVELLMIKNEWSITDVLVYAFKKVFLNHNDNLNKLL